jgi:PAS domain S-box-containing protein
MNRPASASLRKELTGLAVACSLLGLATAGTTVGACGSYAFRARALDHLQTLAALTARFAEAPVAASDPAAAAKILAGLEAERSVEVAVLYGKDGRPLARLVTGTGAGTLPPLAPPPGLSKSLTSVIIVTPVGPDSERGALLMRARLGFGGASLFSSALLLAGVGLGSLAVALLLSRRLLRRVTKPISELRAGMESVEASGDQRLPIARTGLAEIDTLADALNETLDRIRTGQDELLRSRDRLLLVLAAGRVATWEWDPRENSGRGDVRWNAELGLAPHETQSGEHFFQALHAEDRERAREVIERASRRAEDFSLEVRVPGKGAARHLLIRGRSLNDDTGAVVRLVAVAIDTTESRRAGAQVLESEHRFRLMAEKAPALIWACDEELRRDYFNATWLTFTGRTRELEQGAGWLESMVAEDRPRWREIARTAADRSAPYTVEYRLQRAEGTLCWLSENASPRFRADGSFGGYLGTCIDVTAGKTMEAELEARVRQRTRQLEAANHDLGSFSYSVSHDLRAPVRLITGFTEIAVEECEAGRPGGAIAPLRSVLRSAARMNQLIDAFLGLARITRAELHLEPIDLSQLATEILEELRQRERSRAINVTIQPDLRCQGDLHLLRILMENLLGNAWKFTAGRADPRIEIGSERSGGETVFFVADNGAGFDPAQAGRMFQAFSRLHATSQFEGLGVGLNTVQRVIQRHEGRVWASGLVGIGARFCFTLPTAPVAHHPADFT